MSSASAHKSTMSTTRGAKPRQSKELILKLSPAVLSQFPHEKPISSNPPSTKSAVSESSPPPAIAADETPPSEDFKMEKSVDAKSEPPVEKNTTNEQSQPDIKRKGLVGPRAGQKRRMPTAVDGQPKQRAKPGPKKRKLDSDDPGRPWTTPAAGGAGHKLGPKANQGAINAGLRALDRTGKPCRKWNKSGFVVKSFTGQIWSLNSWATPHRLQEVNGDSAENITPNSTSDNQQASSNIGSEASHNHLSEMKPDIVSSPAPVSTPA